MLKKSLGFGLIVLLGMILIFSGCEGPAGADGKTEQGPIAPGEPIHLSGPTTLDEFYRALMIGDPNNPSVGAGDVILNNVTVTDSASGDDIEIPYVGFGKPLDRAELKQYKTPKLTIKGTLKFNLNQDLVFNVFDGEINWDDSAFVEVISNRKSNVYFVLPKDSGGNSSTQWEIKQPIKNKIDETSKVLITYAVTPKEQGHFPNEAIWPGEGEGKRAAPLEYGKGDFTTVASNVRVIIANVQTEQKAWDYEKKYVTGDFDFLLPETTFNFNGFVIGKLTSPGHLYIYKANARSIEVAGITWVLQKLVYRDKGLFKKEFYTYWIEGYGYKLTNPKIRLGEIAKFDGDLNLADSSEITFTISGTTPTKATFKNDIYFKVDYNQLYQAGPNLEIQNDGGIAILKAEKNSNSISLSEGALKVNGTLNLKDSAKMISSTNSSKWDFTSGTLSLDKGCSLVVKNQGQFVFNDLKLTVISGTGNFDFTNKATLTGINDGGIRGNTDVNLKTDFLRITGGRIELIAPGITTKKQDVKSSIDGLNIWLFDNGAKIVIGTDSLQGSKAGFTLTSTRISGLIGTDRNTQPQGIPLATGKTPDAALGTFAGFQNTLFLPGENTYVWDSSEESATTKVDTAHVQITATGTAHWVKNIEDYAGGRDPYIDRDNYFEWKGELSLTNTAKASGLNTMTIDRTAVANEVGHGNRGITP